MKKLLAALLCTATGICFSLTALAANAATLTVGSARGTAGSMVDVDISITSGSTAASYTIELNYDKNKLEFIPLKSTVSGVDDPIVAAGPAAAGGITVANDQTAGKLVIGYINASGISTGGVLHSIKFKILAGATGDIPLTLTQSDFTNSALVQLNPTIVNGKITVNAVVSSSPVSSGASSIGNTSSGTGTPSNTSATSSSSTASGTNGTSHTNTSSGKNTNPNTSDLPIIGLISIVIVSLAVFAFSKWRVRN